MKIVVIALAALLAGCSDHSDAPTDADPIEESTRACTLHSVELVEDKSVVVDGFASAPDAWITEMTGEFSGMVQTPVGGLEGVLNVDYNISDVRVVRHTWNDSDNLCAAWYEIGFGAALTVGNGHLNEFFAATLLVDAGNVTSFVLDIPVEELRGTLRPIEFEDVGALLRIEGDFKQLLWNGDLGWLGEIDDYEAWEDIGAFSFGPT